MKLYELAPIHDARQSFYGKAKIIERNGCTILLSYTTEVAKINKKGELVKLWNDWSSTTGRHIKEFCIQFGFGEMTKKEWLSL